jgi:phosphohistidine phosphatase
MKTLLIMRHAKSSWHDGSLADHDRPLNGRGNLAATRMGQLLAEQQLVPDIVLSSTATRAQTTAEKVAASCGAAPEIRLLPDFYLAAPETYLATVQQQPDELTCILLIGHNPGLELLLTVLTGAEEPLPTAALAAVELDLNAWSDMKETTSGRLGGFWLPRELE